MPKIDTHYIKSRHEAASYWSCLEYRPDTTETAPNSPMALALHKIIPYINPHLILGRVTRQNICHPFAPSETAASSSEVPCACITGINSRATNGRVTKIVAMIMPGTEKIILIPCSTNQGPNTPRGLKRIQTLSLQ